MALTNQNKTSNIENVLAAIFTPGHWARNVLMGIAGGISIVGFANILFVTLMSDLHAQIQYGGLRTALWIAANLYVVVAQVIGHNIHAKLFANKKPFNSESGTVESVRRVA